MNKKIIILIIILLFFVNLVFYSQRKKLFIKSFQPSPSPSSVQPISDNYNLSFAVIGDPEGDVANLKKVGVILKEKGIKYVILVGDLTSSGTEKQFQAVKMALDSWGITYLTIPGNHDLWAGRDWCQKNPSDNCSNTAIFEKYFGQNFGDKTLNDYNFFLIDNSDENLGLGEYQLDWLRSELLEVRSKYFGFFHIPLYHPESNKYYVMGSENEAIKKQAEELLDKFCQNPPLALFFGHLHRSRQYEYDCANGNKLKMINAGSLNTKRNWQLPRFMKVDIKEQRLNVEEIVVK